MVDQDSGQRTDASTENSPDHELTTSRRSFLAAGGTLAAGASFPGGDSLPGGPAENKDKVPNKPDDGGKVRHFNVHAIDVDIVYNR